MVDEQRISDAFQVIAGLAPPPERVRAGIDARARVHRQRRLLLTGAGAATAAVAVGVPLTLRERRTQPVPVPMAPSPSAPRGARVAMLFAPGWLPAGLGEKFRAVKIEHGTGRALGGSRYWYPEGSWYSLADIPPTGVSLSIDERIDDNLSEPIMVGSVRGKLRVTDGAFLEWQPPGAPNMIVSAYGMDDPVEVALRIARSVTATKQTTLVTMRSPEVPDRYAGYSVACAYPTAEGWYQSLSHVSNDHQESVKLVAQRGGTSEPAAFERRLPNGITVTIPDVLDRNEARRLLEQIVCLAPDLSWVGGR